MRIAPLSLTSAEQAALGVKPPRSKRQKASAKGRDLERRARKIFEASGCLVETARKIVLWRKLPGEERLVPRSVHHDFWNLWDFLAVDPTGTNHPRRIRCVQVTDKHNLSARRRKILASNWPATGDDWLLAYAGRGVFDVYIGPRFDENLGPLQMPRKARMEAPR